MKNLLLAIDVGGTKIDVAVIGPEGQSIGKLIADTDNSSPEGLLDSVEGAARRVLQQCGATSGDLAAVGLGVPGQVNPESGVVRLAVNLNLTSFPLSMALAGRLGTHVAVENDVRLAALGLYHHLRRTQPLESLAYVSVGTGIAAGVVSDGVLLRGAHGMAGEIGHTVFDPAGERCLCGLRGCLETIVSGPAIARQAASFVKGPDRELTAGDVYAAAAAGDRPAQQLVHRVSIHLARALYWLVMSYDVEKVVLGGGVAGAGEPFWQPIQIELSRMCEQSTLARTMLPQGKISLFSGQENPGIWGATILAQQVVGRVRPMS